MSRYGYYYGWPADGYFQVDFSTEFNSPVEYNGRSYDRAAFKARFVRRDNPEIVETVDVFDEDFVPMCRGETAPLDPIRRKAIPADIIRHFPNKPEPKPKSAA